MRKSVRQGSFSTVFRWVAFGALLLSIVATAIPFDQARAQATPIGFTQKPGIFVPPNSGDIPTAIALGPDGKLYVGTRYGRIYGLTLNEARDVVDYQIYSTIYSSPNFNDDGSPGGPGTTGRLITGLTFDPASTAAQPVMYVSHSDPRIGYNNSTVANQIDTFSGTITRLTGPNFDANRVDVITGLPRSRENHATNGIEFGPDGMLYILQGGDTNLGAPSNFFSWLPERFLSAAVLKSNARAISAPVDVRHVTSQVDLSALPNQALTLHATGFRNSYGLHWHSNGNLYVNDNGGNSGLGTTPDISHGCPGGAAVNPPNQPDKLFQVTPGMYAGHPNPARGECILDDGSVYSPAKAPEANYVPPLANYGPYNQGAISVNGIAEYPVGAMAGNLISTNLDGDRKLRRAVLNGNGSVTIHIMDDLGAFADPLDIVIDNDGVMYIAEYAFYSAAAGVLPRITALIPNGLLPDLPSISSLSPANSPVGGGTVVEISGQNFVNGATVTFGGVPAEDVTINSATSITATAPPHDAGNVTVVVTNPNGLTASAIDAFYYGSGGPPVLRVNAGGGTQPAPVMNWSADNSFSGGQTYSVSDPISAPNNSALYQSERYGNITYSFSVPNGAYEVTLKFAELYWNNPGQRIFNASINGQQVLTNFDIVGEVGKFTAVDRTFPITVSNGTVTITLTTVTDNAKISAIEIRESIPEDTTPPTITGTNPADGAANVDPETTVRVTFSESMNRSATQAAFTTSPATVGSVSWNAASTIMTFTPEAALVASETYTATVGMGAADLAGNSLASAYSWTFTTGDGVPLPAPVIESVLPEAGSSVGGYLAEIHGTGFQPGATVGFGGQHDGGADSENVTVHSSTHITAIVPPHAPGHVHPVDVTVTNPDGQSDVVLDGFEYVRPMPDLISMQPTSAQVGSAGFTLEVTGADFVDGSTFLYWNGVEQPTMVLSASELTAYIDDALLTQTGTAEVTVATVPPPGGGTTDSLQFTISDEPPPPAFEQRVNAGGGSYTAAGVTWSSDTGFTGGNTYSVSNAISGTTTGPLYQSERFGNSTYSYNVPNGAYTVTLKFAELYWNNPGQRVFNVTINGQQVLTNFDIISQVGKFAAVDRVFPVTVTNGTIAIGFVTVKDNAKISAIEIVGGASEPPPVDTTPPTVSSTIPSSGALDVSMQAAVSVTFSEPMNQTATQAAFSTNPSKDGAFNWNTAGTVMTFTPVSAWAAEQNYTVTVGTGAADLAGNTLASAYSWTFTTAAAPPPPAFAQRVNAGGGSYTAAGVTWSADTGFTGGNSYSVSNAISGTTDDPLYQSERFGNSTYSYNVPNGEYTVTLKFAELYWNNPGQRVFNVTINGQQVLTNLDIISEVGKFAAVDRTFPVTVTNGTIAIGFVTVQDNAKISAIEIVGGSSEPPPGDTTPPVVNSTSPANNATGFAASSTVSVTFSEPMNQSATQAVFSTNPSKVGSFNWNAAGTVMTFTPSTAWTAGQVYTATVGTGATDLAGNAMTSAHSWTFTIAQAGDTTPPTVLSTNPANGATGIVTSSTVSVTFSEPMNQSAAQTAFSTNPVKSGSFGWNGAGTVMTFTPATPWTAGQGYTVTVGTGATDLAGNALASAHSWAFTTAAAPPPPTFAQRVNAGGGSYTAAGVTWSSDTGFTGGNSYSVSNAISGTTTGPLYQSERYGNSTYTFAVPNGEYTVTLKFAELYWNNPGQRVFNVTINGQQVLTNFDIISEVGKFAAVDRTFPVAVTNGTIAIGFVTVKDNAKISAIEIVGGASEPPPGDTTPPVVNSTSPVNNATGVAVSSTVSVTFSEPMNQSATQAAFSTSPSNVGAFSWNGAGTEMTFTPDSLWSSGETYTATIGTGAQDLAGNALTAAHSWSFTIAGETPPPDPMGQWVTMPPMPSARAEVGVVESNGLVYVLGGLSPGGLTNTMFVFNPANEQWTELEAFPGVAVDHAGAAAVDGVVYVIGGLTGWPAPSVATMYAYDPSAPAGQRWSQKASLPEPRGAMAVATINGKIYVAGGLSGGGAVTDLTVYDPATDAWTTLAPMPTARDHMVAEALNGKLHVIGGRPVEIFEPMAVHEVYDPATNSWSTAAPLNTARGGHGSGVLDGKIIVFGGEGRSGVAGGMFTSTEEYDPATNSWEMLVDMATPRHGTNGAVVDGVIYVPGGGQTAGGSTSTVHEAFTKMTTTGGMLQVMASLAMIVFAVGANRRMSGGKRPK